MFQHSDRPVLSALATSFAALAFGSSALAQETTEPVIARALGAVSEEVRVFNEHLTILASPWMEGRVPGSRGMELAKEYMEYQFRQSGLVAPYERVVEHEDGTVERVPNGSFRQPFPMGSKTTISEGHLGFGSDDLRFEHGSEGDFVVTAMGSGGEVTAPVVFVGYGIDRGPREARDFTSFPDDVDLAGKIALVFRFEPMDEEGKSLWSRNSRRSNSWSIRASFNTKLRALQERGVAGAIIVNTPGAADSRVDQLVPPTQSRRSVDFPVLNLSIEAGERLVAAAVPGGHSLMDLRRMADEGPAAVELTRAATIRAGIVEEKLVAENVIGLLPGKGRLKDQYVVVGAHLDHLGMGEFGSRDRENSGRKLHPGADDNASGSAGIMLIADKMARDYRAAPDDANLRSVLFMGFSAEESGLNGSRFYAQNPLVPAEKHTLMMNFDMIGRISDKRLSLSGAETGDGLAAFIEPIVDASPLTIVQPERMSGASDHTSFMREEIPVLFAIIADFHDDYHTARDTPEKINRVDAVHASNLFYEIASAAVARPEPFPFAGAGGRQRGERPSRAAEEPEEEPAEEQPAEARTAANSVRLGIAPGNYGDSGAGVLVSEVFPGTSATKAGIQKGDVIVRWGEDAIASVEDLSAKLAAASPGDKVKMRVKRGDAEVDLDVVLFAR